MGPGPSPARVKPQVPPPGQVVWGWGRRGLLGEARQAKVRLAQGPLAELRAASREELGLPQDKLIVASGHQPLPIHPGILLRELFLHALPKEGLGIWLVVDSDAPQEVSFPVPLRRRRYTHHWVVLWDNPTRLILAALPAPGEERLRLLRVRLAERLSTLKNAEFLRRATGFFSQQLPSAGGWPDWWEAAKAGWAGTGRLRRLYVTELSRTKAFQSFVRWLAGRENLFLTVYSHAARRVGLRPLAKGELPFWRLEEGRRSPARNWQEVHLPRALTLTFFVRGVLCDFFLHGTGGATYEPGVDLLFREVVGIEPPPWGWLTGTFLLEEPPGAQLPEREFPFFLHDLRQLRPSLSGPLSALG